MADRSDYRIEILCDDVPSPLKLERGIAQERLGSPFEINLSVYSEDKDIDIGAALGKPLAVHVATATEERWFHGVICHFAMVGISDQHGHYQIVLRPKLWLLGEGQTSRVFESVGPPDILKDIFQEAGIDFGDVQGAASVRFDHCVQYRETDLEFVTRLMERWGLYYFHRHEEQRHVLEVVSGRSGHANVGEFAFSWDGAGDEYQITDWRISATLRSSQYRVGGTEYLTRQPIDAKSKTRFGFAGASTLKINDFEVVNDYERPHLEDLAKVRMQAIDVGAEEYSGHCRSPKIAVGALMTLTGHPRAEQNRDYLIVGATYHFDGMAPGQAEPSEDPFVVSFRAIDANTTFSSPTTRSKPVVHGPHLAHVVDETDEFGRVKVQVHWGNPDEDTNTFWARVSQNWAGKDWGGVFMPHIGHEVIVEFLDGDPDQPIVTGRVYNQENMPPLALPGDKEKCIIRDHGGNEIMMDGAAQQIRIFCPGHNSEIWLGKSVQISSDSNWINTFLGYHETDIKGKSTTTIGNDNHVTVKGNKNEHVIGKWLVKVGADVMETLLGAQHRNIVGMTSLFVGGMKKEHIVGAEWKRIDGIKREKVRGAVIKDAPKDVLTLREAMSQVKGLVFDKFDDLKQIVKGTIILKMDKLEQEAEERAEKAKNVKQEFKTLTVKGETHSHQPDNAFNVKTKNIDLYGQDLLELSSKLVDISGVLEVKK